MSDGGTDNPAFSNDECHVSDNSNSTLENSHTESLQNSQITVDNDYKTPILDDQASSTADEKTDKNGHQQSFVSQHYVEPIRTSPEPQYKTETRIELPAENQDKIPTPTKSNGVHGNGNNNDASFLNTSTASVQNNDGKKEQVEAVNLELVSMRPYSGPNAQSKGQEACEVPADPYEEYFVPVNEHRKYIRGEKLYVTKDKRSRSSYWRRIACWGCGLLVLAIAIIIAILAATGVILTQEATQPLETDDHTSSRQFSDIKTSGSQEYMRNPPSSPPPEASSFSPWPTTDETLYEVIPKALEGSLTLDDLQWTDDMNDPKSRVYRDVSEQIEENLKDMLHLAEHISVVKVYNISQDGEVKFRISYPPVPTPEQMQMSIEKMLQKSGSMIGKYHLSKLNIAHLIDDCKHGQLNCSESCRYDYSDGIFVCSCSPGKKLESDGRSCGDENDLSNVDMDDEITFGQSTESVQNGVQGRNRGAETTFNPRQQEFATVNPEFGETTEIIQSRVNVPEIYGEAKPTSEPKFVPDPNSEPKSEPEPTSEPNSEPEPSTEPTSEPRPIVGLGPVVEPTAEPKSEPEPASEPHAEPVPAADPKSEPQPSSEPEPTSEPKSEPEPSSESKSEPEPAAEPKSEPEPSLTLVPLAEPTSEPEPAAEPKSEPEPSVTSVPSAEPTSEPEPAAEPKSEPEPSVTIVPSAEPKSEPEPSSKSDSESNDESKIGNKSLVDPNSEPEPNAEPKVEPGVIAEPNSEVSPAAEPTSEPVATVEPVSEAKPDSEHVPLAEPEPEPGMVEKSKVEHTLMGQSEVEPESPGFTSESSSYINKDGNMYIGIGDDAGTSTELPDIVHFPGEAIQESEVTKSFREHESMKPTGNFGEQTSEPTVPAEPNVDTTNKLNQTTLLFPNIESIAEPKPNEKEPEHGGVANVDAVHYVTSNHGMSRAFGSNENGTYLRSQSGEPDIKMDPIVENSQLSNGTLQPEDNARSKVIPDLDSFFDSEIETTTTGESATDVSRFEPLPEPVPNLLSPSNASETMIHLSTIEEPGKMNESNGESDKEIETESSQSAVHGSDMKPVHEPPKIFEERPQETTEHNVIEQMPDTVLQSLPKLIGANIEPLIEPVSNESSSEGQNIMVIASTEDSLPHSVHSMIPELLPEQITNVGSTENSIQNDSRVDSVGVEYLTDGADLTKRPQVIVNQTATQSENGIIHEHPLYPVVFTENSVDHHVGKIELSEEKQLDDMSPFLPDIQHEKETSKKAPRLDKDEQDVPNPFDTRIPDVVAHHPTINADNKTNLQSDASNTEFSSGSYEVRETLNETDSESVVPIKIQISNETNLNQDTNAMEDKRNQVPMIMTGLFAGDTEKTTRDHLEQTSNVDNSTNHNLAKDDNDFGDEKYDFTQAIDNTKAPVRNSNESNVSGSVIANGVSEHDSQKENDTSVEIDNNSNMPTADSAASPGIVNQYQSEATVPSKSKDSNSGEVLSVVPLEGLIEKSKTTSPSTGILNDAQTSTDKIKAFTLSENVEHTSNKQDITYADETNNDYTERNFEDLYNDIVDDPELNNPPKHFKGDKNEGTNSIILASGNGNSQNSTSEPSKNNQSSTEQSTEHNEVSHFAHSESDIQATTQINLKDVPTILNVTEIPVVIGLGEHETTTTTLISSPPTTMQPEEIVPNYSSDAKLTTEVPILPFEIEHSHLQLDLYRQNNPNATTENSVDHQDHNTHDLTMQPEEIVHNYSSDAKLTTEVPILPFEIEHSHLLLDLYRQNNPNATTENSVGHQDHNTHDSTMQPEEIVHNYSSDAKLTTEVPILPFEIQHSHLQLDLYRQNNPNATTENSVDHQDHNTHDSTTIVSDITKSTSTFQPVVTIDGLSFDGNTTAQVPILPDELQTTEDGIPTTTLPAKIAGILSDASSEGHTISPVQDASSQSDIQNASVIEVKNPQFESNVEPDIPGVTEKVLKSDETDILQPNIKQDESIHVHPENKTILVEENVSTNLEHPSSSAEVETQSNVDRQTSTTLRSILAADDIRPVSEAVIDDITPFEFDYKHLYSSTEKNKFDFDGESDEDLVMTVTPLEKQDIKKKPLEKKTFDKYKYKKEKELSFDTTGNNEKGAQDFWASTTMLSAEIPPTIITETMPNEPSVELKSSDTPGASKSIAEDPVPANNASGTLPPKTDSDVDLVDNETYTHMQSPSNLNPQTEDIENSKDKVVEESILGNQSISSPDTQLFNKTDIQSVNANIPNATLSLTDPNIAISDRPTEDSGSTLKDADEAVEKPTTPSLASIEIPASLTETVNKPLSDISMHPPNPFFSKCTTGQFQCVNGTSRDGVYCVSSAAKCDSENDCSDGSDEINCERDGCPGNFQCSSGQCLKRHLVCNGIEDCDDGSDEKSCAAWNCQFDEFQCPNGRCIPFLWKCDGRPDCEDHRDEYSCAESCRNDEYLCPTEKWCIPLTWHCNGVPECAHGEDEKLCDCALDQFKCQTGGCVALDLVCDGVEHCPDHSDEWDCLVANMTIAQDNTEIQKEYDHDGHTDSDLVGHAITLNIRQPNGERRLVCSDNWTSEVSDSFCREQGYFSSETTDMLQLNEGLKVSKLKSQPNLKLPLVANLEHAEICETGKIVQVSCQDFSCGSHYPGGLTARLAGGTPAGEGQWSSVALLKERKHGVACTASILSPMHALASYSCIHKYRQSTEWQLFTGGDMLTPHHVRKIIPYPQVKYNQFLYNNDMALVELEVPLVFSRNVSAVCLPRHPIQPRQLCVTAGWGFPTNGEINLQQYLKFLPIPTYDSDDCNATSHYAGFITKDNICAGFTDTDKGPCYDDEGAPLMCASETGRWELQGLLSHHSRCSRGHPAIYSSLAPALSWLHHSVPALQARL